MTLSKMPIAVKWGLNGYNPQNPKLLHSYFHVRLQLERAGRKNIELSEVQPDAAVVLDGPEGEVSFVLEDSSEKKLREDELGLETALAKKLMGAVAGDNVEVGSGRSSRKYEVSEVLSKYTYRARKAMKALSTRFADEGFVRAIPVGPDLHNLFFELEERAQDRKALLKRYDAVEVPLYVVAHRIGSSLVSTWQTLNASGSDYGRWGSRGYSEISPDTLERLTKAETLALSTTGFLAVDALSIWGKVTSCFDNVIGSKNLLDDLKRGKALEVDRAGDAVMGKVDGDYFFEEYPEGFREKIKEKFQQLLESANNNVEFVPINKRGELSETERSNVQMFDKFLGASAVDAAYLGAEENTLFLEDDLYSRNLLSRFEDAESISIGILLDYLNKEDMLGQQKYYECLAVLVEAGFRVVAIEKGFIGWLLNEPGRQRPLISSALKNLSARRCSAETALVTGAEILKDLWLGPHPTHHRDWMLDEIMMQVVSHGDSAIMMFRDVLREVFGELLFVQYQKVNREISRWMALQKK